MKKKFCVIANFAILLFMGFSQKINSEEQVRILATTFPIYQFCKNITKDSGINLSLLLPSNLGCPHDYALTPQDLIKLSNADILVINGLGLEEFIGTPLKNANPKLKIIDSSSRVTQVLKYSEKAFEASKDEEDDDDHDDHDHHQQHHHHQHDGINPHLFASPALAAKIVGNIANELSKIIPEKKDIFTKNSKEYSEKLLKLSAELAEEATKLKNKKIIQPHGIFDYFAREFGLQIVATIQTHGGEPSTAEILNLIKTIKDENVGAIVSEPQYSDKTAQMLSKETNVPHIKLDPAASGIENAPLDHYEKVMRENMKILKQTLGN